MAFAIIRRGYRSARATMSNPTKMAAIRAKAREKAEDTVEAAAVIAGGAAAGYIESEWADKDVFGVNIGLIAGGALMVAGMMGWAGRSSHIAGSLGEGMLAYEAGKRVLQRGQ